MATKGAPLEALEKIALSGGLTIADSHESPDRLSDEVLCQMRLAHLGTVQSIIGRLAGHSATLKTFSVTLAAAAVAVTFSGNRAGLLWIPVMVVTLLGSLDAYYLAQERAFRERYREIAGRPLSDAADLGIDRPRLDIKSAFASFSVWGFYLPQLVIVLVLLATAKGLV